jgi:N-hydroxyarylamine O-acetyltransferase
LAAALEQLGFRVTRLLARVRIGGERLLPRTHMVLEVAAQGQCWLADVGFGAWGLLDPLPLVQGDSRQHAWTYRLANEGSEWTLSAPIAGQWHPLYTFTREPQLPIDYEPANWYTSTHPDSRFVQTLTAQMPTPEVRYTLRNRELTVVTADGLTTVPLATDAELLAALAEKFRLDVQPGPWLPPGA